MKIESRCESPEALGSGSVSSVELRDGLHIESGSLSAGRLTAYGIFRNEVYFAEPFLQHYRKIGIEQFIILDDGSTDGTRELLASSGDVTVLSSPFRFGDEVVITDMQRRKMRVGPVFKSLIPQRFLKGEWALYVDADEFLLLPPPFETLQQLIAYMANTGDRAALASLVDFYPRTLSSRSPLDQPRSFDDLVAQSPFFDAEPLVEAASETGDVRRLGSGASARLLAAFDIRDVAPFARHWPAWMQRLLWRRNIRAPTFKSPLLKWDDDVHLKGSHRSSIAPSKEILLALAHFKFTPDLPRRISMARDLRSYASKSRRYDHLAELVAVATRTLRPLTGPTSRQFGNVGDLVSAGLLRGPNSLGGP